MCRSRRELSNAYVLAKFGFDTDENEPSKVWPQSPFLDPVPQPKDGKILIRNVLAMAWDFRFITQDVELISLQTCGRIRVFSSEFSLVRPYSQLQLLIFDLFQTIFEFFNFWRKKEKNKLGSRDLVGLVLVQRGSYFFQRKKYILQ